MRLESNARAHWRHWSCFVLFVVVAACATTVPSSSAVIKSPNDARAYRSVVLPNGLSVLLVSDPKTDKAAGALTVFRGSYDDPKDRAGLAHFLEHMLFLGTAKYPQVEGYQTYITTHGGTYNAYTSSDHTNFFFDVRPDYLQGALDRFAQFFIAPTFDAEYVEREKNAVNSEYQLYLKDDNWRSNAVNKEVFNPTHPGSRFSVGSLDTLKGDVRTDLIKFYQTHYSADQMALVVLGNQSLDELDAWVTPMFSAIPRRAIDKPAPIGPLYAPGVLPRVLTYQTIKDTRQLNYNFPVPELDSHFRDKPGEYISNLLGHEGPGSLDAELKARGWIELLAASASRFDRDNGLITISIDLTPEGEAHVDAISRAVFEYIALVRADGVARWRYQEQAEVAELAFRFQEQSPALAFASRTAPAMRLYPVPEVLEAPYLMERYDEALIKRYLAALTTDNLLLEVSAQKVDADQIEPWFQVPYRNQKLSIDLTPKPEDNFQLALPAVNEFLPKNLALQKQTDAPPHRLDNGAGLTLWWAPDTSFGAPRANTYVQLNVAGGFPSPTDSAYADLYSHLVLDALNTYAYPAQLAGLGYDIDAQSSGFLVTLNGYNDKQPLLLTHILDVFAHLDPTPEKIANYRDELQRAWLNFAAERPFEQGIASLSHVMINGNWPPGALASAIQSVTPASLATWRKAHLSSFNAVVLLHGNVDEAQAQSVAHIINTNLNLSAFPTNNDIVARLPAADLKFKLEIDIDDAAMILYLQGTNESYRERALFGLMGQILRTPYFADLRTRQQLGYAVFVTPSVLRRTPGLAFVVQSPVAGANALVRATEKFLASYRQVLIDMQESEFNEYKQGLIGRLLESDKNLNDRSSRYWNDLDVGFTDFDSRKQIAAAIQSIDKPTLLAFYDRLLDLEAHQRLIIYNAGRFGEDPVGRTIDDVGTFRAAAGSFGAKSNGAAQATGGQ